MVRDRLLDKMEVVKHCVDLIFETLKSFVVCMISTMSLFQFAVDSLNYSRQ